MHKIKLKKCYLSYINLKNSKPTYSRRFKSNWDQKKSIIKGEICPSEEPN